MGGKTSLTPKLKMKIQTSNGAIIALVSIALSLFVTQTTVGQNTIQFTKVNATSDGAIQLYWASNPNEIYEIDYADAVADVSQGGTTWNVLYTDYPSHGNNTFIADCGNYDVQPEIPHPKNGSMRFYRVVTVGNNTSPSNPNVAITSPRNGDVLSGEVTVSVSASSSEILDGIKLYIDGEEQWASVDGTNFVLNTTEWSNGPHTLFATAESVSALEGIINSPASTHGRSVSSYVTASFNNLISQFSFSQPFFEPELGQIQKVTASFTANVNWTLEIQDVSSNDVRVVTGSGGAMEFDWDGTGANSAPLPDGNYSFLLTAQTNGLPLPLLGGGGGTGGGKVPPPGGVSTSTMTDSTDSNQISLPPMPPGFETQVFSFQEPSFTSTAVSALSLQTKVVSEASSSVTSSSQSSRGPEKNPYAKVKGKAGTIGIAYKTYPGSPMTHHPLTGFPYPLNYVAVDGQQAANQGQLTEISGFRSLAKNFTSGMKNGGWKTLWTKENGAFSGADIKKASLGGKSIFNNVNFGLLMVHGSYATSAEADGIKYNYGWLGVNDYFRLSDLDLGGSGADGLRWMTILGCNILYPDNTTIMFNNRKYPINGNLHLLLGNSTKGGISEILGNYYAENLLGGWFSSPSIFTAFGDAETRICTECRNQLVAAGMGTLKVRVIGWQNCLSDSLRSYAESPDTSQLVSQERTVFQP